MQPDTIILIEDFKAAVLSLPDEEQDAVFDELDDWLKELEGDDDDEGEELDDDETALAPADSEGGAE